MAHDLMHPDATPRIPASAPRPRGCEDCELLVEELSMGTPPPAPARDDESD